MSKKIAVAVVALGVTLVVTLGLGEWVVRYLERNRTTVPSAMSTLYYPHRRLGRALVRNADYYGWATVNADGFRGPPVPPPSPTSLRVMAIGGSTTFDAHVSGDSAAWPSRLEFWLNELQDDTNVDVINAGVPGYRVIDNLIRWQTELRHFAPDIVILYHAHNDLYGALADQRSGGLRGDRPDEIGSVTPWSAWLGRHSLLYHKVRLAVVVWRIRRREVGLRAQSESLAAWEPTLTQGARDFASDLSAFAQLVTATGAILVVPEVVQISGVRAASEPDSAIAALWARDGSGVPLEAVLDGYRRFALVAGSLATEVGYVFLPRDSLAFRRAEFFYPGNPIHFRDAGAERFARTVAEDMLEAGVLAAAAARR